MSTRIGTRILSAVTALGLGIGLISVTNVPLANAADGPVLALASPTVTNRLTATATIHFTSDMDGSYAYVVATTKPSDTTLHGNGSSVKKGDLTLGDMTVNVTGLSASATSVWIAGQANGTWGTTLQIPVAKYTANVDSSFKVAVSPVRLSTTDYRLDGTMTPGALSKWANVYFIVDTNKTVSLPDCEAMYTAEMAGTAADDDKAVFINTPNFSMPRVTTTFSGSSLTYAHACAYYLDANGDPVWSNVSNVQVPRSDTAGNIPPILLDGSISNRTATSAIVTFSYSGTGANYYYRVGGTSSPAVADVVAGVGPTALTAGGSVSFTASGLPAGATTVYIVGVGASDGSSTNSRSDVLAIPVGPAPSAPTLSSGSVTARTSSSASVSFLSDMAGSYQYVVSDTAPSASDMKAGTVGTTVDSLLAGSNVLDVPVTTAATSVWVIGKSGDEWSNVLEIPVAKMGPTLTNPQAVTNRTSLSATTGFTSNSAGTYAYVVSDTQPTLAQLAAGTSGTLGSGTNTLYAAGLTAAGSSIWVAGKDTNGNWGNAIEIPVSAYTASSDSSFTTLVSVARYSVTDYRIDGTLTAGALNKWGNVYYQLTTSATAPLLSTFETMFAAEMAGTAADADKATFIDTATYSSEKLSREFDSSNYTYAYACAYYLDANGNPVWSNIAKGRVPASTDKANVPPTLSNGSYSDRTAVSATVTFSYDIGTNASAANYYYLVGGDDPSVADVVAGVGPTALADGTLSFTVSGLSASPTTVYIVGTGTNDQKAFGGGDSTLKNVRSSVLAVPIGEAPKVPTLSSGVLTARTAASASVSFTSDLAGTYRYVVSDGNPSVDEVKAGTLVDSLVAGSNTLDVTTDVSAAATSVWVIGLSGGEWSKVLEIPVDAMGPTLTNPLPVTNRVSATGTIGFTSDMDGTYFYVVSDTQPTLAQLEAGASSDLTSRSMTVNVSGLIADATNVWVAAQDAAGNWGNTLQVPIAAYVPNPDASFTTSLSVARLTRYTYRFDGTMTAGTLDKWGNVYYLRVTATNSTTAPVAPTLSDFEALYAAEVADPSASNKSAYISVPTYSTDTLTDSSMSASSSYYYYACAYYLDNVGNPVWSNIAVGRVPVSSTAENVPPALAGGTIVERTADSVTLTFSYDKGSGSALNYYYRAGEADAGKVPAVADVVGTTPKPTSASMCDTPLAGACALPTTTSGTATLTVTGLSVDATNIYLVGTGANDQTVFDKDRDLSLKDSRSNVLAIPIDAYVAPKAPVLTVGSNPVTGRTASEASVSFTSDMAGTYVYLLSETAPEPEDLQASELTGDLAEDVNSIQVSLTTAATNMWIMGQAPDGTWGGMVEIPIAAYTPPPGPLLSNPQKLLRDATTASVGFRSNMDGTYVYMVQDDAPTTEELQKSDLTGVMTQGIDTRIDLVDLTSESTSVWVLGKSDTGLWSKEPLQITLDAVDIVAPVLTASDDAVTGRSETVATVKFTSTEAGEYAYVVSVSDPSATIKSETLKTMDEGINTIGLTDLTAQATTVWIIGKDAAENWSTVLSVPITAIDVVPPVLSGGSFSNRVADAALVSFTSSEAGMFYYVTGTSAPADAASVVASGTPVEMKPSASGPNTFTVTDLPETATNVYVVGVDGSGNRSDVLTISVDEYVPPVGPLLTDGKASERNATSVNVSFTSNMAGTYVYIVSLDRPTDAALQASELTGELVQGSTNSISVSDVPTTATNVWVMGQGEGTSWGNVLQIPVDAADITAPELSNAKVIDRVEGTATVTFTSSEAGQYAYVVSLTNPDDTAFEDADLVEMTADANNTINLTDLTVDATSVWIKAVDAAGNWSDVFEVPVGDLIAPTLIASDDAVTDRVEKSATVTFTSSEAGQYAYVVSLMRPDDTAIKNATATAMTADVNTINLTELSADETSVWIMGKDAFDNWSEVLEVKLPEVDVTAPVLTADPVTTRPVDSATVTFTSSEAGLYGYVETPGNPNMDELKAAATTEMTTTTNTIAVTDLTADATSVWIIAKDAAGNWSTPVEVKLPAVDVAPPELNNVVLASRGSSTATVTFDSSEAGKYGYLTGTDAPNEDAIHAAATHDMTSGTNTIELTELTSAATTVWIIGQDAAGNWSIVAEVPVDAFTAPILIQPQATTNRTSSSGTVGFRTNMDGSFAYIVSATPPTDEAVRASTKTGTMTQGMVTLNLTGLTTAATSVWVAGKNADGTWGETLQVPVSAYAVTTDSSFTTSLSVARFATSAYRIDGTMSAGNLGKWGNVYYQRTASSTAPALSTFEAMYAAEVADPANASQKALFVGTPHYSTETITDTNTPAMTISGTFYVYACAYYLDANGNPVWSSIAKARVPQVDSAPNISPTLSGGTITDRTDDSATVTFTFSKTNASGANYYYRVGDVPDGKVPPVATVVDSSLTWDGLGLTSVAGTGTLPSTAGSVSFPVTGLPSGTTTIYLVGTGTNDQAAFSSSDKTLKNSRSNVLAIQVGKAPVIPTLTLGSVTGRSASAISVSFTSDMAGTYSYLVSDVDPSVEDVQGGTSGQTLVMGQNSLDVDPVTAPTTVWIIGKSANGTWGNLIGIPIDPDAVPVGPELTNPQATTNRTSLSATVGFESNMDGMYSYIVSATRPTDDALHASTLTGSMTAGQVAVNLSGLTADQTTMWVAGKTADGAWGTTFAVPVTAYVAPEKDPNFGMAMTIARLSSSTYRIDGTMSPSSDGDWGHVYYTYTSNATPPTMSTFENFYATEVADPAGASNKSSYIAVPYYSSGVLPADNMTLGEAIGATYYLWACAYYLDDNGNPVWSDIAKARFPLSSSSSANVPPTLSGGTITDRTADSATVTFTFAKGNGSAVNYYYRVGDAGDGKLPPVASVVDSSLTWDGLGLTDASGTGVFPTAAGAVSFTVTGLTSDATNIYLVGTGTKDQTQFEPPNDLTTKNSRSNVLAIPIEKYVAPTPVLTDLSGVRTVGQPQATFSFTSNIGGTYDYVIADSGASLSAETVKGTQSQTLLAGSNSFTIAVEPSSSAYIVACSTTACTDVIEIPLDAVTVPTLDHVTVSDREPTTATLSFDADQSGTYWYLVASTEPDAATLQANGKSGSVAVDSTNQINLTGLTRDQQTRVWVMLKGTAGYASSVYPADIPAYEAPNLSVDTVTRDSVAKGTVTFVSDTDAMVYWLSKPANQDPPTEAELQASVNQMDVEAMIKNTLPVTGLVGGDAVNLYMIAQDSNGHWSRITVGDIPAVDKTAPTLTVPESDVKRLTVAEYTFTVTTDLTSKAQYVVVPTGQDAPSAEDIQRSDQAMDLTVGIGNKATLNDLTSPDGVTVYLMAYTTGTDGEKYWSELQTIEIPVFAETEPIEVTNISAVRTDPTTGSVSFGVDKAGHVVTIVSATEPSDADFNALVSNDTPLVEAGSSRSVTVSNLASIVPATVYFRVYYINADDDVVWSDTASVEIPEYVDNTPPALTEGHYTARDRASATVSFRSNEAGTYAYLVSSEDLSADEIKASTSTGPMIQGVTTINLEDLNPDATIVWIMGLDAFNNWSTPIQISLPAVDVTAPKLSDGLQMSRGATTATVSYSSDEKGTLTWMLSDENPGRDAILASPNTKTVTAGTNTLDVAGLSDPATSVWLVVTDAAGNSSDAFEIKISEADRTPPVLSNGQTVARNATTAKVTFTSNEAGSFAYVAAASNPGDTAIKNLSPTAMVAGTNTINLTSVSSAATTVWVMGKDAMGNWSLVTSIPVPAATGTTIVDPTFQIGVSVARLGSTTFRVDGTMTPGAQDKWGSVYYTYTDITSGTPTPPSYSTFESMYQTELANPSTTNKAAYIPVPDYSSDQQSNSSLTDADTFGHTVYLWAAAYYKDENGNLVWSNIAKGRFPLNNTSKNVPPALTLPKVASRTADSAEVSFKASMAGAGFKYYYRVGDVYAGNTPSVADVIKATPNYPDHIAPVAGSGDLTTSAGPTTITLTGITSTATNVYIVAVRGTDGDPFQAGVDDSPLNARSNVLTIKLDAVATAAPSLTAGLGTRATNAPEATFSFTSDKAGTYHYVIADTPQTAEDVINAANSHVLVVGPNNTFTSAVGVASNAYVVACAGDDCSSVYTISLKPVTAPALSALTISNRQATTATFSFTSDQAGTYRYVVSDTIPDANVLQTTGTQGAAVVGANPINLTGFDADATTAWVTELGANGYWSTVYSVQIPPYVAPVGPTLSVGADAVSNRSTSTADVAVTSDMAGTYAYIVSSGTPTADQVKAGATGTLLKGETTIPVIGLSPTESTVWIIGQAPDKTWGKPISVTVPAFVVPEGPVLDKPQQISRTASTARVGFSTNMDGTYAYIVALDDPGEDAVHNSPDKTGSMDQGMVTIDLTELTSDATNVWVAGKTAEDVWGNLLKISVPAADITPPSLSNEQVSDDRTESTVTVSFDSSEVGTFAYIVKPSTDTAPVAADFESPTGTGTLALANTLPLTGLTAVPTTVYVLAKDAAGNVSSIFPIAIPVFDETAPTLSNGQYADRTAETATVSFDSDEVGSFAYIVQPSTDAAPVAADFDSLSTETLSPTNSLPLTGLTAVPTTVYVLATDAAGNTSDVYPIVVDAFVAPSGPVVSDPAVVTRMAAAATISFTSNVAGMYSIIPSDEPPAPEDYEYGFSDDAVAGSNTVAADYVDRNATTLWIAVQDEDGVWSEPVQLTVPACDPIEGDFNLQLVSVERTSETTVKVTGTTDQPGFLIFMPIRDDADDLTALYLQGLQNETTDPYYPTGDVTIDYASDYLKNDLFDVVGQQRVYAIAYNYDENDQLVWSDVVTALIPNWEDTQPPTITAGEDAVADRTSDTATVSFLSDEGGTYYYMVSDAATPPAADSVVSSGTSAVMRPTATTTHQNTHTNTMNLTDLPATATTVYVVGVDASGNQSTVLPITIDAAEATAGPVLTAGAVSDRTAATADVSVSSDMAGTYAYLVSSGTPSADEVKAGTTGTLVLGETTIPVMGLPTTESTVWIIGQAVDQTWGDPISVTVPAADLTAPALTDGQVISRAADTAKVGFRSNEDGTYAYVVSLTDPGEAAIMGSSSTGTMDQGMTTIDLAKLTADATSVWVMGKDASGNWSDPIEIKLDAFDTTAPALTNAQATSRTATAATVTFDSNEAGQYAYYVATSDPGDTVIKAAKPTEMIAGTNTINLTDLTPAATSVWIMAKDATGNWSTVVGVPLEAVDMDAPALSDGKVTARTVDTATVTFASTEAGQYAYTVSATKPDAGAITAAKLTEMTASTNTIKLTNLSADATSVWIMGKDAEGNWSTMLGVAIPFVDTQAPTLTKGTMTARAATTATVTFDSDEAGQYAYVVATANPGQDEIAKADLVPMESGTNTVKLKDLTADATSVWIMAKDATGNWTATPIEVKLAAVDVTAPTLTNGTATARAATTATVTFDSDEAGQYAYVVSAIEPDEGAITGSATKAMVASTNTIKLTDLSPDATSVWIMGKDDAGNWTATPIEVKLDAVDVTAPVLSNGQVPTRTATTATVTFTASEAGQYAYVVAASKPDDATIKAATPAAMVASTNTINLTDVSASATSVWIMGTDASGNWTAAPFEVKLAAVDVTAPTLINGTATARAATTATVTFTSNEAGQYAYVVSATAPDESTITGSATTAMVAGTNTVNLKDVTPNATSVWVMGKDAVGNWSTPIEVKLAAVDVTAPTLTNGTATARTATAATVKFDSNEAGQYAYVVSATDPGADAIQAAKLAAMTASTNTINLTELTADATSVWVMGKDASGNWSAPVQVKLAAVDVTAPALTKAQATSRTADAATVTFDSNEAGQYAYVVSADKPDADAIQAAKLAAMTASTNTINLIGLTADATSVWIMGKDASGNWSTVTEAKLAAVDINAPALTDGKVTARSATEATVTFTSSEVGQYAYVVAASRPSDETIEEASLKTMVAGTNTINLTGLTDAATSVWVMGKDAEGNWSTVLSVAIPVIDVQAPALSDGRATDRSATEATVTFTSSEVGQYAYVVAASQPSDATIKAASLKTMSAGTNTINLTELTAPATSVWIMGKDASGNWGTPIEVKLDAVDVTAPTLTDGQTISRAASTASVGFRSNEAGTYAYVVSATNPGEETIKASTATGTMKQGMTTVDLTGLSAAATSVWIMGKDASGNWGTPIEVKLDAVDVTAPTLTDGQTISRAASTASVGFRSNEAGTYAYVVSATNPGEETIKASTATGTMKQGMTTVDLTGLSAAATSVWVMGKDAAGNWSTITEIQLAEVDVTAPTLTKSQATDRTAATATVTFTSDEAGQYAYVVASGNPGDTAIKVAKPATMVSGVNTINLIGLTADATSVWVMGKDAAGNWSAITEVKLAAVDVKAPTLTGATPTARTADAATVTFTSDEAGQYAFMVATTNPGDTAIKDGDLVAMTAGTNTINLKDLTPDATSVWIMGKDKAGNWSAITEVKLTAVDVTAPTLTDGRVTTRAQDKATVAFTTDEGGQYAYIVSTIKPSEATIKAVAPTAMTTGSSMINLTELTTDATNVWVMGEDAAGNWSTILQIPVSAYVAPIGPELTSPQIAARTATDAKLTFQSNADGEYAYIVSATKPDTDAIKKAAAQTMDKGTNTVNLTELTADPTSVWIMGKDSSGVWGSVLEIPLSSVDVTAPTLTDVQLASRTATSAAVTFTSSEAGEYAYIVSATEPGADAIKKATATAMAAGTNTIDLTGLTADVTSVWVMAKDAAGNWSEVTQIPLSAVDVVAPTLTKGEVVTRDVDTAQVSFTSSEEGTYAYVVAASDPGDADIKAATPIPMASGENTINLTGLTADVTSVWVMGKDAAGNWSKPLEIEIPLVEIPVADPAGNSFLVDGGFTQTAGAPFMITALGDRQTEAGNIVGEQRYIPTTASADSAVTFALAGDAYLASMTVPDPGPYTLKVTYQLQEWNGTTWSDVQGKTDTKSETLTVVPVADTDAPTLSSGTASDRTATSAKVAFTSDEAGTYAYIVRPASELAPIAPDFETADTTGAMVSGVNTIDLAGLTDVATNVYVMAKDAAGNWSTMMTVPLAAVDVTAPNLSDGQMTDRTAEAAKVTFTSDDSGTFAYVVAVNDPGKAAIMGGTTGTLSNGTNTISLAGLTTDATSVWIMARDAAGNWSDALEIQLADALVPSPDHSTAIVEEMTGSVTDGAGRLADGDDSYMITATVKDADGTGVRGQAANLIADAPDGVEVTGFTDMGDGIYTAHVTSTNPGQYAIPVSLCAGASCEVIGTIPVNFIGAQVQQSSVAVGDKQSATGRGFLPGETVHVMVHSTPIDLGDFTADPAGNVPVSFIIPADFDIAGHTVTFAGKISGTVVVDFTVTSSGVPTPTLAPTPTPKPPAATSPKAPLGGEAVGSGAPGWVIVVMIGVCCAGVLVTRRLVRHN